MTPDEDGLLPLHFAAKDQGGENGTAVVETLLKAAPEAAMIAENSRLPLHIAIMHQGGMKGVAVLKALLRVAPEAALAASKCGLLHVHLASIRGDTCIIRLLLRAAPSTVLMVDKGGLAPFHFCGTRDPASLVLLMRTAPQALLLPDDHGLWPVIHRRFGPEYALLFRMLVQTLSTAPVSDAAKVLLLVGMNLCPSCITTIYFGFLFFSGLV